MKNLLINEVSMEISWPTIDDDDDDPTYLMQGTSMSSSKAVSSSELVDLK